MTDPADALMAALEPEYVATWADASKGDANIGDHHRNALRAQLRPLAEALIAENANLRERIDRDLVHLGKSDGALCGHHPGYMSTMRITDDPKDVVCKPCFDLMLEALTAERDAALANVLSLSQSLATAIIDRDRLREALRELADHRCVSWCKASEIATIALLAALGATEETPQSGQEQLT